MQTYNPIDNALVPYVFPEIENILQDKIDLPSWDTRHEIMDLFREECRAWLQNGLKTKISGLERFPYVYIIYGASQYIDDLPKFEDREIAMHKHEYAAYPTILSLNNRPFTLTNSFAELENSSDNLTIVSYPFSLNGNDDLEIIHLLNNSKNKIVLDSVFLGTNMFNVNLDFNKLLNVETFLYSFSKGFGMRYNRIGIMFTEKQNPEYEIYHSYAYHNLFSAQLARKIMSKYHIDYFTDKYSYVQKLACNIKQCDVSDCLHIGLKKDTSMPDRKERITDVFRNIIDEYNI